MVRPEGWLRWFAHSLGHDEGRGMGSTLPWLPALQKWQLGGFGLVFFVYCPEFVPIVHACGWF